MFEMNKRMHLIGSLLFQVVSCVGLIWSGENFVCGWPEMQGDAAKEETRGMSGREASQEGNRRGGGIKGLSV